MQSHKGCFSIPFFCNALTMLRTEAKKKLHLCALSGFAVRNRRGFLCGLGGFAVRKKEVNRPLVPLEGAGLRSRRKERRGKKKMDFLDGLAGLR